MTNTKRPSFGMQLRDLWSILQQNFNATREFSLPRFSRCASFLVSRRRTIDLAGQLIVGQAPSNNVPNRDIQSFRIGHAAVVKAVCLLIEVAEKVEGLDADVGASDGPLEQAPEVFQPVGVNVAAHVFDRMVNHFMLKFVKTF